MDDIATQFSPVHEGRRVFHMATHTKFVLDRDDSVPFFGSEESRVLKQKIRIETLRQLFALGEGLFQTFSQSELFLFQIRVLQFRLPFRSYQFCLRKQCFFLELLCLFHQLDLVILDLFDLLLKPVDLLADCLEFVVFAGLVLLGLVFSN